MTIDEFKRWTNGGLARRRGLELTLELTLEDPLEIEEYDEEDMIVGTATGTLAKAIINTLKLPKRFSRNPKKGRRK